jgi:thiol:disulfide interchange protein DsbA
MRAWDICPRHSTPANHGRCSSASYYTAVALGLMPKMHETIFSGVWTSNELAVVEADGRKLKSPQPTLDDAAKFIAKKAGIKPEQFLATAKSFSVDATCRRADQLVKAYKITARRRSSSTGAISSTCPA